MDILASSFALFFFEYGHDRFLARKGGLPDCHLKHVHSRCQLVNLHANSCEPFLPAWSLVNLVHLHSAVWPSLAWCTRIKQDTLVDLKAGSSLLCFVITKGAAANFCCGRSSTTISVEIDQPRHKILPSGSASNAAQQEQRSDRFGRRFEREKANTGRQNHVQAS
jgi:ribosomal protein L31